MILTLFWDSKRAILEHYTSKGATITSASYCDLLENQLKPAIRTERRGLPNTSVLMLHDNARPHTAHATVAKKSRIFVLSVSNIHYTHLILLVRLSCVWGSKGGIVWKKVQI